MSFRELRNFCEIMRSLGYPRIISMENFRSPNFMLVAEIIFWLIKRFDPKADIPDSIEEDKDRVEFIKAAAQFFFTNLKIKLNLKKLYGADGYCVQELLKISEVLYKAQKSVTSKEDFEYSNELDISSRLQEIKQIKNISNEIVETGVNLLDLLEKEKILKSSREKAIDFLDNITRNIDSKKEQEQIEQSIINILKNQGNNLQSLEQELYNKKEEEKKYEEGIKQKTVELERLEKRLEQLLNVKPAHFQELKQMEQELAGVYRVYVEKLRNHDYLSHQLEIYHKIEEEQNKVSKEELERLQKFTMNNQNKFIRDENELLNGDDDGEDFYGNYEKEAVSKNNMRGANMQNKEEDGEEEQEEEEDVGEESGDDNQF